MSSISDFAFADIERAAKATCAWKEPLKVAQNAFQWAEYLFPFPEASAYIKTSCKDLAAPMAIPALIEKVCAVRRKSLEASEEAEIVILALGDGVKTIDKACSVMSFLHKSQIYALGASSAFAFKVVGSGAGMIAAAAESLLDFAHLISSREEVEVSQVVKNLFSLTISGLALYGALIGAELVFLNLVLNTAVAGINWLA